MNKNSHDAHESIKPSKENLHAKIKTALKVIEKGTFREIAKQANLQDMQVWKRLSEMERLNIISNVSDKRCEISGRSCSIWTLTNNN